MKPAVWQREDGVIAYHEQKEVDSQGFKWRPLYTAPSQLSDEEIKQIFEAIFEPETDNATLEDFICEFKAILKKASEK